MLDCWNLLALRYGVLAGPLLRSRNRAVLVLLPVLGHVGGQGVVGVGGTQQGLDRQQNGSDLQGGRPVVCGQVMSVSARAMRGDSQSARVLLTLQNIQADATQLVDVGVVDLGEETNLGGHHGIVVCQE